MTWAFDVTANIPRITQSGTDTGATPFAGIDTAIAAVGTVARNTPYTTASPPIKPPGANGMWYRCSQNGTTAATAPTFDPTNGSVTTDGTAKFTAFRAPSPLFCGTGSIYFFPDVRLQVTGTLTNTNPQQQAFWCWDLITYGSAANFTSGSFSSDGVTPLWDGLHFTCTRVMTNNSDPGSLNMQVGSKVTLIGGEMQIASAIGVDATSTLKAYYTRFRNTKEWGAASSRIRNYSATSIYRKCEFFDVAFDRFNSPAEFSVKARGSEYLVQYIGSGNGGVNAKFVVSGVENIDGTNDIDNYGCGWMEAWNCAKGALLKVVSQNPGTAQKAAFFVPLFQDVAITTKNTLGALVDNVRYSCTDVPNNSPPSIITTFDGLKAWDFVNPLSYQTTSNASGVATAALALAAWWWKSSTNTFQTNLRFPLSTATFEGRAYGYKPTIVSVVLGSDDVVTKDAGMIATDTATILSESAALTLGKFTFTPSGATGGNVTATASYNANELWDCYQAWISQYANRASNDTWTAIAGKLNMAAWTLTHNTGVTGSAGSTVDFIKAPTITLNGTAKMAMLYETSAGGSTTFELRDVKPGAAYIIANNATKATILYGVNNEATPQTYTVQFAPGSAGTQIYVARKAIGDFFDFEVVTLAEGLVWTSLLDIPDEGAKETSEAALNAYTALETNTKVYNYMTGIYMRTEAGMKLGNFFLREGKLLKWAAPFSALVKKDAAGLIVKSGNVFQIKTNVLADDENYDTHILVPPATMTADTDEIITTNVEDANGNSSVTIAGGDNLGYKLWKVPASLPADGDETTGTLLATVQRNDKFRFIGLAGFDIIGVDNSSGVRRRTSMAKGIYRQTFYVGDEIQLSDEAPQLIENNEKLDVLTLEVNDMQAQIDALQALVNALPQAGDVVDANIVKVNGVTVDGTGSESDPWGPQ